ncbi:myo-inosose-2 dehydratase [Sphingomonas hengshuiensis]|uniref:MocC n=1 Tax=Sphingomonas hengshuiensis TaxID=1609977 RepID=A0A7U4J7S1_9SPHN|nr:myo-inosose-2 dehydratase [Sphingomonas hengshuiensis]AJP71783.1 MocC [Sphingomonas hengshuiensis]
MTLRWGVSPIAWANDDLPELGGGTTLETILADAQAIGFEGVELGHLFPRDLAVLAPLLARYELALVGGWYGASLLTRDADAEIAAMAPHLDLLARTGAGVVVLAETSNAVHGDRTSRLDGPPRLAASDWASFGGKLDRVAAHVARRGLRLAYHHHLGTVVENGDDLERLLAVTGQGVGITLDTGHAHYGGIDPVAVVRDHPHRIAHVHCKDVRAARHAATAAAGGSFLDGVIAGMFTVPGDGDLDFAPLFSALETAGYNGWIVVEAEQDPAKADPRAYSTLGLKALRAITGRRGA